MDPDATMADILHFAREILYDQEAEGPALALAEHVRDLDEWLVGGGFPPRRWRNTHT